MGENPILVTSSPFSQDPGVDIASATRWPLDENNYSWPRTFPAGISASLWLASSFLLLRMFQPLEVVGQNGWG